MSEEARSFICIGCPLGCKLDVTIQGEDVTVYGNACKIGSEYGVKEVINPRRMITSSVTVEGGEMPVVSVKTQTDIPKPLIFDCMDIIKQTRVTAPVNIGDIIIKNICGTGVDIVATRSVGSLL